MVTLKRCKSLLAEKIKINMREYNAGKFSSRAQAIAVSYSQVKKMFPNCSPKIMRKVDPKTNNHRSRSRKSRRRSRKSRRHSGSRKSRSRKSRGRKSRGRRRRKSMSRRSRKSRVVGVARVGGVRV